MLMVSVGVSTVTSLGRLLSRSKVLQGCDTCQGFISRNLERPVRAVDDFLRLVQLMNERVSLHQVVKLQQVLLRLRVPDRILVFVDSICSPVQTLVNGESFHGDLLGRVAFLM